MNVSNGCHSARTIGQFSIAHGFAMAYHLWFHPDGGWPSDTKHHSWPSHSQKVWYCVSKGIGFQPKGGGRHRQAPSAAFKCFRQSGSEGIIGVRTCHLIFFGWLASIHHSIGPLNRCIDTWLCNGFASMVSAWLGTCNVSCYTYMNVSNGCHSAKTTGQLPVTNGFTMIADDGSLEL